jgi:hypothetical protein
MYKTELKNLDTDDLESIKDSLRILETFLFNIQSIDKDLKKKKLGFSATSRKELRKMYTFWKTSSYNVSHTLWARKGKKGKEPKKSSNSFGFQEKPNFKVFKRETPTKIKPSNSSWSGLNPITHKPTLKKKQKQYTEDIKRIDQLLKSKENWTTENIKSLKLGKRQLENDLYNINQALKKR